MTPRRSKIWIALHALVALLPLVGAIFQLPDVRRFGVELPADFPSISFADWRTEKIQPAFQAWFERRIGFRGVMVRTDNSLQTTLLEECQPGSYVLIANEDTYFSADDVRYRSTQARDLPPILARIAALTEKLGSIHKKMQAKSKTFVVVIAASKSVVYPETIPDRWKRGPDLTDAIHDAMRDGLTKNGVPFGDADAHFRGKTGEDRRLIWYRTARHWTLPGACLALRDALAHGDAPVAPNCEYDMVRVDRAEQLDFDLYRLMNIWGGDVGWADAPITKPPLVTPAPKPRALFFGTSFLWMLADLLRPVVTDPIAVFYNTTFFDIGNGQRIGSVDPNTPLWAKYVLDRDLYVIDILETFAHFDEQWRFVNELDARLN